MKNLVESVMSIFVFGPLLKFYDPLISLQLLMILSVVGELMFIWIYFLKYKENK